MQIQNAAANGAGWRRSQRQLTVRPWSPRPFLGICTTEFRNSTHISHSGTRPKSPSGFPSGCTKGRNRVTRARDDEPSSRRIQVRDRCHGRAARMRREELIMSCCRRANKEMLSGVDGRMAQGGRLRAIAFVRATYRRCRRPEAATPRELGPLSLSWAAWHDGRMAPVGRSRSCIICSADPHAFSGRARTSYLFTVVKPKLSRHFPGRGGLVGGHAGPIENGAPEALPLVNLIQGLRNHVITVP